MKRTLTLAFLAALSCTIHAQAVNTTVCEILKNPQSFNNKIVRIKGTVNAGLDQFIVKGDKCGRVLDAIWLSYPEGTKAKSGPLAVLELQPAANFSGTVATETHAAVTLDKNSKDFKQFDSLLSTPRKGEGMCLGCMRYQVSAALTGRIDATEASRSRDKSNKITAISGFGNLNAYNVRMVIQSVEDVTPQEIDYSKANAATKGETAPQAPGGKPTDAILKAAEAFGTNPAGDRIKAAVKAYDGDSVILSASGANEVVASHEGKGSASSPDGMLYYCTFDSHLKGDALSEAMVHIGQHIADIRTPQSGDENLGVYGLEAEAWQTTVLLAVAKGQKTLTIPGGYMLWEATWTAEARDGNLREAIASYLANEVMVSR